VDDIGLDDAQHFVDISEPRSPKSVRAPLAECSRPVADPEEGDIGVALQESEVLVGDDAGTDYRCSKGLTHSHSLLVAHLALAHLS
jgi:hypothetical protein